MLKKIVVLAAVFSFLLSSSLSFAEEKEGLFKKLISFKNKAFGKKDVPGAVRAETKPVVPVPPPAAVPKITPPKKTYTREEMIADMKKILDGEEQALNSIPGLKKITTESGESFYDYEGSKLEDLDKEKLSKIFTRVRQEAMRIRTDRLNRQLENIRRNQQLTAAARVGGGGPRVPAIPSSPARVYSVPRVPVVPASASQPPRTPAPPPAPPRR